MSYDPIKWHYNEMLNMPRKNYVKYLLAIGLALSIALIMIAAAFEIEMPLITCAVLALPSSFGTTNSPFTRMIWFNGKNMPADEFEMITISKICTQAYKIIITFVFLMFIILSISMKYQWIHSVSSGQWVAIACGFAITAYCLPICIAEWKIPIPPEGDEA